MVRTAPGSELDAATRGGLVAFEIDQIDPASRSGWSVLGWAAQFTGRLLDGR